LEDLHGVDSSGVIGYCCLLLRRRSQKFMESREANIALKGQKLRPKAENKGELLE